MTFKDVGIIIVQEVLGDSGGFFGRHRWCEATLKDSGFAPGNGMKREICNSRTLRGKRELRHHRYCSRQHVLLFKTRKPNAEVKRIRHSDNLNVRAIVAVL